MEKQLHLNLLSSRPPAAGGLQAGSKMRMGPGRKRDFSPLGWSCYFQTIEDVEVETNGGKDISFGSHGPVLLLLHGGGHSALSWAVFTAVICGRINCRVVAMDLRGHGDTKVQDSEDLSAETMASDISKVVEVLYGDAPPPILMIGHSMGGAIAVHAAAANHIPSLLGLCVIDVVEGTAMEALNSMQSFLRSRPKTFKSLENAIEWSVKSGQIRNIESARVSMGGQVKKQRSSVFEWRVDLSRTERFWTGWFRGLSALFLSCTSPKLLLLAGVDRLDKDLTIGQMQGKFQLQVLPQCGHAVHEDAPDKVADAIASFMVRHKFTDFKEGFLW
uniref:Protein phosphatase methylesterase 1 n=1 Tax=Gadus morhua TaxID=8049 RepID=A0A8C5F4C5_GADMO